MRSTDTACRIESIPDEVNPDDIKTKEDEEAPEKTPEVPFSPLFSSEEEPFGIRLEPQLVSNLRTMIGSNSTVDFRRWSPVLGISSSGAIVLNWEKSGTEEE